jgi:acetyl-CoA synthetase
MNKPAAPISSPQLVEAGLPAPEALALAEAIATAWAAADPAERWRRLSGEVLHPRQPFAVHRLVYDAVFAGWDDQRGPRPAWTPTDEFVASTNEGVVMRALGLDSHERWQAWSAKNRSAFWTLAIDRLGIRFQRPYQQVLDPTGGVEAPHWLRGARLNIVESCFAAAPDATAVLWQREGGSIQRITVGELQRLANRVSNALAARGFARGDAVAVAMPMTAASVAIYLGVVQMGGIIVSIADSFAPAEIGARLRLGRARAVFTQDIVPRSGKILPMYEKVAQARAAAAFVLPAAERLAVKLRPGDEGWARFLGNDDRFEALGCQPDDPCNILFSSGTTGEPKAIPWTHTTPIKCAMDGHFHHNIQPGDVVAWPTNLGWMMGPWLIFASLINRAGLALYEGAPTSREFGCFVQGARVTMLGVVPSLVKAWRTSGCLDGLDWSAVTRFSSTGECSNAWDYLWLMSRAGYAPVIEYCGGTEIGGGYLTGTVTRPASPATFNSLALGLDAVIVDEDGEPADRGELFLVPPSIGLSTALLNKDHHEVYFAGTPAGRHGETLRRHGDEVERLPGGWWRAHGRADDTMNLGGIKVSSAEIERTVNDLADIEETAAVAVSPPDGGPSRLVIYAVVRPGAPRDAADLRVRAQAALKTNLNPLFKVHEVVIVDALPRTASHKVMRRSLRDRSVMVE